LFEIGRREVEEIATLHIQLQNYNKQQVLDLTPFLSELGNLKTVPHTSTIFPLGYFALLESLLTHAPEPKDIHESLTKQIMRKVKLLNNRLPKRIDYSPFGQTPPETIWKKMYAYRRRRSSRSKER
jgi:hypothetical protein